MFTVNEPQRMYYEPGEVASIKPRRNKRRKVSANRQAALALPELDYGDKPKQQPTANQHSGQQPLAIPELDYSRS